MHDGGNLEKAIRTFVRLGLQTFFRDVQVNGLKNIPKDRGGILIAWHPNGMVDPALIFSFFPKSLVFGARHGLFQWPLLGMLMRHLGTVPIYRRQDIKEMSVEEQRVKNQESLEQLAARIAQGSFSALFPEGVSHDDPCIRQLKTGAARIFVEALSNTPSNRLPPVIIPVGLHYDTKNRFRSSVLLNFHPPIELSSSILSGDWESERARWDALTLEMEHTLTEVIYALESWEMHRNFHRAALLIRAERLAHEADPVRAATIDEQVIGLARLWSGYHQRKDSNPTEVEALIARVESYRLDMEALGLLDHQLDGDPRWISKRALFILLVQTLFYFLFLPPILLVGYVVNFPTTALIRYASMRYTHLEKDQASVQLFASLIGYPLTWSIWAGLAYVGMLHATPLFPELPDEPMAAALFVLSVSMMSCVVMFVYLRAIKRMYRAWRVRWTKKRQGDYIQDLLKRRQSLAQDLIQLAEGLELPGVLGEDNRLHWEK